MYKNCDISPYVRKNSLAISLHISRRLHSWWCPSVNFFKFQPCDHSLSSLSTSVNFIYNTGSYSYTDDLFSAPKISRDLTISPHSSITYQVCSFSPSHFLVLEDREKPDVPFFHSSKEISDKSPTS
jgi:hypothetical protein